MLRSTSALAHELGVAEDKAEAVRWFLKPAEQGVKQAMACRTTRMATGSSKTKQRQLDGSWNKTTHRTYIH